MQADEVEAFGTFGGDLPVEHSYRKPKCKTTRATGRPNMRRNAANRIRILHDKD
ncbi:hypothetical protein PCCS19_59040 [Paenibacillus sp. CCS19]|nr:hypothetical protein PCCS19_59040 [Paenibacillus cellulosilyticus]